VRQAKIIVPVIPRELLAYARLVLAECDDAPPDGSHMLADREVDAFNEGGIDLPTRGGQ
jgi:hypothetical protein